MKILPIQNTQFEVRLILLGISIVLWCAIIKVEAVTCKDCHDVDKPGDCRVSTTCGSEEICSTEEYTDVNGLLAYRLGCANSARCRLFMNAKSIFGKRQISTRCYECCDKDDCNANACQSSGGHITNGGHVTTISPSGHHTCAQVIQSNNSSGCPQMFVPFKDKCYFVGPSAKWMPAKTFCRQHGGNLVSVNSKKEHDFLKGLVNQVNASFISAYWTGGFYSHEAGEYEYVDGSPFSYTLWTAHYPPSSYSKGSMYYVWLANPAYGTSYKDLPMGTSSLSNSYQCGIICETNRD